MRLSLTVAILSMSAAALADKDMPFHEKFANGLAARARSLVGESRHLPRQEKAAAKGGVPASQPVRGNESQANGTINAGGRNSTVVENQGRIPPQQFAQGQVIPPQQVGGQVWVINGQAVELINGQLVAVNQNQLQMVQVVPVGVVSTNTITQCRVVAVQEVRQANAVIVNGQVVPVQAIGGQFQQFQAVGQQGQFIPVQVGNVQGVPSQGFRQGGVQAVPVEGQGRAGAQVVPVEGQGQVAAAAEAERAQPSGAAVENGQVNNGAGVKAAEAPQEEEEET